jgi:hypothetical protein
MKTMMAIMAVGARVEMMPESELDPPSRFDP